MTAVLQSAQSDADLVADLYNRFLEQANREQAAKELLKVVQQHFQPQSSDPLSDLVKPTHSLPTPPNNSTSIVQHGTTNRAAGANYYENQSNQEE